MKIKKDSNTDLKRLAYGKMCGENCGRFGYRTPTTGRLRQRKSRVRLPISFRIALYVHTTYIKPFIYDVNRQDMNMDSKFVIRIL